MGKLGGKYNILGDASQHKFLRRMMCIFIFNVFGSKVDFFAISFYVIFHGIFFTWRSKNSIKIWSLYFLCKISLLLPTRRCFIKDIS